MEIVLTKEMGPCPLTEGRYSRDFELTAATTEESLFLHKFKRALLQDMLNYVPTAPMLGLGGSYSMNKEGGYNPGYVFRIAMMASDGSFLYPAYQGHPDLGMIFTPDKPIISYTFRPVDQDSGLFVDDLVRLMIGPLFTPPMTGLRLEVEREPFRQDIARATLNIYGIPKNK